VSKRFLPLLVLVAALAATAAGCGSSSKSSSSQTTTAATTTAATTTNAASSSANGGGTFKVGLNTDTGGLNDRGFNHLAYLGLLEAVKKLGVQYKVTQSNSTGDYIPNLASLARQGYNLVIGVGFTEIQALEAVAKQFPKTHFAIVDVSNADEGGLKNVEGLLFKEQQVGYLAGYAAGLAAKARGGKAVSTVGGQKQPPVDRYIAGFQAGAKAADPGIQTLNNYSQDFEDQAKCKEIALNQIAAGSVVVFQVAGGCGLGALDAAKEKNVWGVGVDADQGFLGSYILTSAEKRVDTAVYDAIRDAKEGKFKGGTDAVYGLPENGVGLGKFSPKTPAGIAAKVQKIRAEIISGKITNIPTTVK
jgi:basic membrane protein A